MLPTLTKIAPMPPNALKIHTGSHDNKNGAVIPQLFKIGLGSTSPAWATATVDINNMSANTQSVDVLTRFFGIYAPLNKKPTQ